MKRTITVAAALALLAAVAVGPAPHADGATRLAGPAATIAKDDCLREKGRMGKRAFQKRFGPRRAMAKCLVATMPAARAAIAVATSTCQAELDGWGLAEFLLEWESFAECVSLYADWEMDGGIEDDPDTDIETDEE